MHMCLAEQVNSPCSGAQQQLKAGSEVDKPSSPATPPALSSVRAPGQLPPLPPLRSVPLPQFFSPLHLASTNCPLQTGPAATARGCQTNVQFSSAIGTTVKFGGGGHRQAVRE